MKKVKGYWLLIGLVLVVLPLMNACAPKEASPPTGELKEFTIEASELKYSPASITVSKGDKVKITLKNVGAIEHDFVIEGLEVSTPVVSSGSISTLEFTVDQSGTFAFYCSVLGHREGGMEGIMTVK